MNLDDLEAQMKRPPEDRHKNEEHGRTGYSKRGCRCEICRSAHNAYMREYMHQHYVPTTSSGGPGVRRKDGTVRPPSWK